MLCSIRSQGVELLAAPVRVVAVEDGEPSHWDDNYSENEAESFIQRRNDEEVIMCGAKQSDRFIVDSCTRIGYDGGVDIDLKWMPRGRTVAQVFGVAEKYEPMLVKLDRLWLEIPLRAESCHAVSYVPKQRDLAGRWNRAAHGNHVRLGADSTNTAMPFKALLWLGNEERGLGWYAENDRNWQPEDPNRAMELVRDGEQLILRVRLLSR